MSENPNPSTAPAEAASVSSAAPPIAPQSVAPSIASAVPLWSLVVVVVLALAGIGFQWYDSRNQISALQQELARRLAEGEARNKEAISSVREARIRLKEYEAKLESLEGGLTESQNQQVALEALYQQLSRSSDEWALSEIEQTLTIAAQQLQLAGNVKAALLALQTADARLQRIDRPQLMPLRKVIERDIELLRVSPFVDVVGLALKIDNLVDAVGVSPLAMQQRPSTQPLTTPEVPDTEHALARLAREVWQDLRSLVRIQTVDRPELPLVDPGQEFFLRENLKLRLLSARIALLQRDVKTYRTDLQVARHWIERFYDPKDRNVAAALATLKQLSEVDIDIALPDINASLSAVRDYKLTREKGFR